jgi:hypothetical protein
MSEFDLHNWSEGYRLKEEGMSRAANKRSYELKLVRKEALRLGQKDLEEGGQGVDVEMVMASVYSKYGISNIGPAAGSIFKDGNWIDTKKTRQSTRKTSHCKPNTVWKLKTSEDLQSEFDLDIPVLDDESEKKTHDSDCSFYSTLDNNSPEDGICTCGYAHSLKWKGDGSHFREMYSKERLEYESWSNQSRFVFIQHQDSASK